MTKGLTKADFRQAFAGYGRALRDRDDSPLEGEPWLSMDDAAELSARLVAARTTSSAGLVEALEAARAALHQHYVDWDGEPEDAVPLQLARSKCDEALAAHKATPNAG